jgi:hypothetical protein
MNTYKLKPMKYLFVFLLAAAASCTPSSDYEPENLSGYVPIYASQQQATDIGIEAARPTVHAGKIYAYGAYLFQVEENEGIHIINNTNPQQAVKVGFLKIPTCSELSIKSNFLYTNNLNDLVVFDISNISSPQLVHRVADAFPAISQSHPQETNVYFECPDPAKGVVVGWKLETIAKPKCRR